MCITLSKTQENEIKTFILTYLREGCIEEEGVLYSVHRSVYPAGTNLTNIDLDTMLDKIGFNKWSMPNEASALNSLGTYQTVLTIENTLTNAIGNNSEMIPINAHVLAASIAKQLKGLSFSVRKTIDKPNDNSVTDILLDGLYTVKPRHDIQTQVQTVINEFHKQGIELFQPHVEVRTPDSVLIERGLKEQPKVEQPKVEQVKESNPTVDNINLLKIAVKNSFPKDSYPMESGHDKVVSDIVDSLNQQGLLLNTASKAQLNAHMEDVFREDVNYETPAAIVGSKFMKRINNDPFCIEFEKPKIEEDIEQRNMSFKM
jgi:hypothetical protein